MNRKYLKLYEEFSKDPEESAGENPDGIGWYSALIQKVKASGNKLKSVFDNIMSAGSSLSSKLGKIITGTSSPGKLTKDKDGWYSGDGSWYWNTIKAQSEGKNQMSNGKSWKIYIPNAKNAPEGFSHSQDKFKFDDMPEPANTRDSMLSNEVGDSEELDSSILDMEESARYISEEKDYLISDNELSLSNIDMEGLISQIKSTVIQGNRMGKYKAPLIWGAPGIGKTEVVLQAAKSLGLPLIVIPLANMQNVDFLGLPVVGKDGATTFAPPVIFPRQDASSNTTKYIDQFSKDDTDITKSQDSDVGGIIFLDEINRADAAVLGSCLSFISLRIIGQYKLPEKWHIIAACNREKDVTTSEGITEMDAAVASTGRFRAYNLVPNLVQWTNSYARSKGMEYKDLETGETSKDEEGNVKWKIPNEIIDFLEFNEYDSKSITDILAGDKGKLKGDYKYFYRKKEDEVNSAGEGLNASPRQWSDLGRFLSDAMYEGSPDTGEKYSNLVDFYKSEPQLVTETINGEVGRFAGSEFIRFLKLKSKVDFNLVPKVFTFSQESEEIQKRIIKQLGETGVSSTSKKGSRVGDQGFAFLSAVSGYASTNYRKMSMKAIINYIDFLLSMDDEITAVTQFIKSVFPLWNNVKKSMAKALDKYKDDSSKTEELKKKELALRKAWEKLRTKLKSKWSNSFNNVFNNIDEWNSQNKKNK